MVQLIPMNEMQFCCYLAWAVANYAQESVQAGDASPQEAEAAAQRVFARLLPDGLATDDHYLYSILDKAQGIQVGYLWFGLRDDGTGPYAALYDFVIFAPFRRRGYGTQALQALEEQVRRLGLVTLALHVFGHNRPARALYEQMGYQITSDTGTHVMMSKAMGARPVQP